MKAPMHFTIEHEQEDDGRWLAEVPELPGVLAYGATALEAMARVEALALRVLAERLEHNETGPQSISIAVA
jgi:predicted RNase H-like HicB family nuclease